MRNEMWIKNQYEYRNISTVGRFARIEYFPSASGYHTIESDCDFKYHKGINVQYVIFK